MTERCPAVHLHDLRLVEAGRPPWSSGGSAAQSARVPRLPRSQVQFDFVVDGRRLPRLLQDLQVPDPETPGSPAPFDLVSVVDTVWPGEAAEGLQRLVGDLLREESSWPLGPGRLPLYVCSQCGDLMCGAITAAVVHDEVGTTWSDFRYEDGYLEAVTPPGLSALGPFVFAREPYREALLGPVAGLLALAAADRASEQEHRRRRTPAGLWRRLRRR